MDDTKNKYYEIQISSGEFLEVSRDYLDDEMNWNDAVNLALRLGNEWRLPTNTELELIYEKLHSKDHEIFIDKTGKHHSKGLSFCLDKGYWSSENCENSSSSNNKSCFSFKDGIIICGAGTWIEDINRVVFVRTKKKQ